MNGPSNNPQKNSHDFKRVIWHWGISRKYHCGSPGKEKLKENHQGWIFRRWLGDTHRVTQGGARPTKGLFYSCQEQSNFLVLSSSQSFSFFHNHIVPVANTSIGNWRASADNARLYFEDDPNTKRIGAWCGKERDNQWLQVDLGKTKKIRAIATQGE